MILPAFRFFGHRIMSYAMNIAQAAVGLDSTIGWRR
jgi:hypothetical protein